MTDAKFNLHPPLAEIKLSSPLHQVNCPIGSHQELCTAVVTAGNRVFQEHVNSMKSLESQFELIKSMIQARIRYITGPKRGLFFNLGCHIMSTLYGVANKRGVNLVR